MELANDEERRERAIWAQRLTKEHTGAVEAMAKAMRGPLADIMDIHRNSSIRRLLEDFERNSSLTRLAEGPLGELRRLGVFDPSSPFLPEFRRTQEMMDQFESRFQLPGVGAAARLVEQLRSSPTADIMARYSEKSSTLQSAIDAMQTPWIDGQDSLRSVGGFALLQGIGSLVEAEPAFEDRVSDALRVDLGDWRDRIAWPDGIFEDLLARSEFYVGLGFDPALTDFPAPAFQESTEIAGLRREPPPLVEIYGAPVPAREDDEYEQALLRTNVAHDWLLRLETQLRQFIDVQMTGTFGADWAKRRLPGDLHDNWREKKVQAENAGAPVMPLISYADFTDYERVICKRDNWREVFEAWFGRPERVRETFQRLYPIRLDTMHARPITQDDELLLYVETRRLIKVIVVP